MTDSEGKIDPEQLERTTLLYQQLADQLTDPNMKAAADTGKILAPGPLSTLTNGTTLLSGLSNFVNQIVAWLVAGGTGVRAGSRNTVDERREVAAYAMARRPTGTCGYR